MTFSERCELYFKRYAYQTPKIQLPPSLNLFCCVVIPAFNENAIDVTITSLANCIIPDGKSVEVIVVINAPENAEKEVLENNQKTFSQLEDLSAKLGSEKFSIHSVLENNLPNKIAGVGLARKIGMDEALHRFCQLQQDGIILSLDADCKVSPDYFLEIEKVFTKKVDFITINFEHAIDEQKQEEYWEIIEYELYLRYFKNALSFAGYPNSMYTIGSCFGSKSSVYAKSGGMNKRKAGEDFYFLYKLKPHFTHHFIKRPLVFPSCRESDRTPFGTGKTITQLKQNAKVKTYGMGAFLEAQEIFSLISKIKHDSSPSEIKEKILGLSANTKSYLDQILFEENSIQILNNSGSGESLQQKIYSWFDGLKVFKMIKYLSLNSESDDFLYSSARKLLEFISPKKIKNTSSAIELLKVYRQLDQTLP